MYFAPASAVAARTREAVLIYPILCTPLKQGTGLYQCSSMHLRKRKKTNKELNVKHYGNKIKIPTELLPAGRYYKVETAVKKKPKHSNANFVVFTAPGIDLMHACTEEQS